MPNNLKQIIDSESSIEIFQSSAIQLQRNKLMLFPVRCSIFGGFPGEIKSVKDPRYKFT